MRHRQNITLDIYLITENTNMNCDKNIKSNSQKKYSFKDTNAHHESVFTDKKT